MGHSANKPWTNDGTAAVANSGQRAGAGTVRTPNSAEDGDTLNCLHKELVLQRDVHDSAGSRHRSLHKIPRQPSVTAAVTESKHRHCMLVMYHGDAIRQCVVVRERDGPRQLHAFIMRNGRKV